MNRTCLLALSLMMNLKLNVSDCLFGFVCPTPAPYNHRQGRNASKCPCSPSTQRLTLLLNCWTWSRDLAKYSWHKITHCRSKSRCWSYKIQNCLSQINKSKFRFLPISVVQWSQGYWTPCLTTTYPPTAFTFFEQKTDIYTLHHSKTL